MLRLSNTTTWAQHDILDLGGQDVNGTIHDLLPSSTWTVLDIMDAPGVDIVADATTWVPTRTWSHVVSTELLEHVKDWPAVLRVAHAALDPGGILIVTCASTHRHPHGATGAGQPAADEHYANVNPGDMVAQLEYRFGAGQFQVFYTYPPGDLYAYARKRLEPDPNHPQLP